MATGGAEGFLRCGCMSGFDSVIERRPYHRNCGCALHGKNGGCPLPGAGKSRAVSYPIRRSWSEGSLVLMASAQPSSAATSPAVAQAPPKGRMRRLGSSSSFCDEFEEWRVRHVHSTLHVFWNMKSVLEISIWEIPNLIDSFFFFILFQISIDKHPMLPCSFMIFAYIYIYMYIDSLSSLLGLQSRFPNTHRLEK